MVHEDDTHLAPVVAVDDAGEGVDAVADGEAGARPDEADVAGRDLQPHAGRDRGPAAGGDLERLARAQVRAGGLRGGVLGERAAVADVGG